MAIDFHPSASKHGISRSQVRHVIEACPCPLYSDEPEERDLVIVLGPDEHGVPVEVVAIEMEDDDLLVIHAMKMRRTYAKACERVMACR
ncbi:MAG TPA: hypothetical protein VH813_01205 [Candidatus Limnocylindrales bacterium]|jgi:hypothetical protein